MSFDEKVLRDIIRKLALKHRLTDLLFTDEGQRITKSWPKEKLRKIILDEISKM
jgi:hypothetical protein